ncbi:FkbM family methyltransferase [Patescibacteria group bacterium]|nr:FkbM family methyltransferase [Patescibacteria group bacterium]
MDLIKSGQVQGSYFWYLKNDRFIGQRIALDKYEPYITKLFLEYAEEEGAAADVGANIGYDTVLLSKRAKKVYAFEPDKDNYKILVKNLTENTVTNVAAYQAAVGSKGGEITLYKSRENLGDHRVFRSEERNGEKVRLVKLDEIILERVGLIKIDTQGFEPAVMEGAKNIIYRDRPTIFWEYWPWAYKQAGLDYQKMIKFLEDIYGQIYYIDEYIQIIRKVDQKWLDSHFPENDESKQGNLMVSTKLDIIKQYKDFWPKKWLKRKLGYPLT